jgi:hypothetical protein
VNSFITWLKKPSNSYFSVTTQLLLLSVCFFSVLYWVDTEPTYGSDYEFFEFEQTVSYSSEPPVDSKDWHPVKLPQRLSESFVDKKFPAEESWTSLWYRKQFKGVDLKDFGQQNNRTWAIYIIEPYANVAIYLNDSFIGESGPMRPPIPSFRRPVMFQFPKELIKSGDNTIYYRVAVGSRNPWPNHLSIGPSHLFEEKYSAKENHSICHSSDDGRSNIVHVVDILFTATRESIRLVCSRNLCLDDSSWHEIDR